jgi:hypothetical protein
MLELNEADKRELESREQEIKSTINGFKDKFLTTIGLATTIFLGLASLNILKETMIILIMVVVILGIISYVILSYFLRNVQFTYALVKAARYKPVLRLIMLKEILVSLSLDDTEKHEHLKNVFNYIKLVGMSKFESLEQYNHVSQKSRFRSERLYFDRMKNIEEGVIYDATRFYANNKEIFRGDEKIIFYESQLARFFGDETLFEQYERYIANLKPRQFKNSEWGLTIEFPVNWTIDSIPEKIKKIQRLEKTVVTAHPVSGIVGSVSLTVKNLDISNLSVYPTKSLAEVVKFQIGMLDLDTETILEEMDWIINGYSARKIVYISRFRSLIDKLMKIWLVVNEVAYEISYNASNPVLFDSYYDDVVGILNSFKISQKSF